jgi:sulfate adenylyltransferase
VADLGSVIGLPSWHPPVEVLELAELVLSGALDSAPSSLPLPDLPAEVEPGRPVVLEDAQGTPVATLQLPVDGGPPRFGALRAFTHGPARSARRTPARVRAEVQALGPKRDSSGVIAVPVSSLLRAATVRAVLARAEESGQAVLWLAVFGAGRPTALPPEALWRAVRAVADDARSDGVRSVAVAVAVPLAEPAAGATSDPAWSDDALVDAVARAYGATEVFRSDAGPAEPHPIFAREHERAVPPPHRRGVTIFFTGLSGSGKSTVARALADRLAEQSTRTVSLLDGDEVRRLLSAGLGFSRVDRDLNIRRIGYVATEVSRHGGLAICAPIAPFAQTRAQVRAAVEEVGDFVLIHISTPLAECERRDRKGLYAKARQGLIPDFTGISSPYEVPVDAALRLDTSRLRVQDAVDAVWELLSSRGYLANPKGSD